MMSNSVGHIYEIFVVYVGQVKPFLEERIEFERVVTKKYLQNLHCSITLVKRERDSL